MTSFYTSIGRRKRQYVKLRDKDLLRMSIAAWVRRSLNKLKITRKRRDVDDDVGNCEAIYDRMIELRLQKNLIMTSY